MFQCVSTDKWLSTQNVVGRTCDLLITDTYILRNSAIPI